ncbi:alpha/beta hydrolase [Marmoricola sp. RAF53]|uniref:alpha/beta hydrolase n=1 Tax=Marmoricola sp. RAF53 TaxID=3233059 RepID=UPI003F9D8EAC
MAPTSTEPPSGTPSGEASGGFEPDLLGAPYTARTLHLRPDAEGAVVATLVRRPAEAPTGKAVLHVHGFCDYFFQRPLADYWCARGYDFYALDLRKYGRSLLPHQTPNYVDDLAAYHEELDQAYDAVAANYDHVVLSGHSTGGLIVPLWATERRIEHAGMVLNAPWLDFQGDLLTRRVAVPVVRRIGPRRPMLEIPRTVDGIYGRSLHRDHHGEWDFELAWKPLDSWPIYAGWIAAVRSGQLRVARGLDVRAPVLVLSSARSTKPKVQSDPAVTTTDIVLDVEQIRRRAPLLGRHVTVAQVEGAMHDVFLSAKPVRDTVLGEIDRFLAAYVDR